MSIKRLDGTEVLPTTVRPRCPYCSHANRKGEVTVLMRVKSTRPTDHPQIFIREYVCCKCGHLMEDEYIMPTKETDYFYDHELADKEAKREERAERARSNFSERWKRLGYGNRS